VISFRGKSLVYKHLASLAAPRVRGSPPEEALAVPDAQPPELIQVRPLLNALCDDLCPQALCHVEEAFQRARLC